jgi:hypothetical protein
MTLPAADPAGAARTALPTRFRIAARGLVSDVLKADPEGEFVKYADVVSHLAGQAGPEVRGLVERLMSPTAEGTIETRTALLAAYEALRQQRDEAERELRAVVQETGGDPETWMGAADQVRSRMCEYDQLKAEAASERQRAERLARVLRDARENDILDGGADR